MFYFANTLQPLYRAWFYTDEVGGAESGAAVRARARIRLEAAWQRVDARLRQTPYIAGNTLSAVDFHATMLMLWSEEMPTAADQWGAIAEYLDRMRALRSFAVVQEREGLRRGRRI